LVYSTCTLTQRENENQIASFLERHPEFTLASAPEVLRGQGIHIDSTGEYLLLLPHRTGTDGFFAAVMTRSFIDS
jgi:16S rRNA (cytosine967-C5)-methyltransferase